MAEEREIDQIEKEADRAADWKLTTDDKVMEMEEREQPFIVDKMIPEQAITAITADVGKGKSLFMLYLMGHLSIGEKLFDTFDVKKKKVLIMDLEMSENDIISRHKSVIKEAVGITYFYCQSFFIDNEEDYKRLVRAIKEGGFGVVVFDTLNTAHTKEENSASEMRQVNRKLLDLINETGVTIIYCHHHRKLQQGEQYAQASSRGSTEILAKAASHILLNSRRAVGSDGQEVLQLTIEQFKSRLPSQLEKVGVNIFYDEDTKQTDWKYLGRFDEAQNKADEAKKFVLKVLEEGFEYPIKGLLQERVRRTVDVGEKAIREACKELVKEGKIISRSGNGNQWRTQFYQIVE